MVADPHSTIDSLYRSDWGKIVATLIRVTGDFDVAEEAAQEAFAAASIQWRTDLPDSPRAWIIQTARHKAIDLIRRRALGEQKVKTYAASGLLRTFEEPPEEPSTIPDDRLRLIFTCCHPALAQEEQVALTLRMLGGLETDEIARAFLVPVSTMAQRIVRAKHKIRNAGIPYFQPDTDDVPARLDAVLKVIYLIFNEGYAATRGQSLVRTDLCSEAIRLGRLVRALPAPDASTETTALLALMLLHDARRAARVDEAGDIVLLEEQDRGKWDHAQIAEALPLVEEALAKAIGPLALQAAIAAEHCRAGRSEETDWPRILRHYDLLQRLEPSPIVALNRAVAVAMVQGIPAALELIDALAAGGELDDYHLLHAARADLSRRIGAKAEAARGYTRALELATHESERRFLERRLRELDSAQSQGGL